MANSEWRGEVSTEPRAPGLDLGFGHLAMATCLKSGNRPRCTSPHGVRARSTPPVRSLLWHLALPLRLASALALESKLQSADK